MEPAGIWPPKVDNRCTMQLGAWCERVVNEVTSCIRWDHFGAEVSRFGALPEGEDQGWDTHISEGTHVCCKAQRNSRLC